jgi:hypothetical protein
MDVKDLAWCLDGNRCGQQHSSQDNLLMSARNDLADSDLRRIHYRNNACYNDQQLRNWKGHRRRFHKFSVY